MRNFQMTFQPPFVILTWTFVSLTEGTNTFIVGLVTAFPDLNITFIVDMNSKIEPNGHTIAYLSLIKRPC